MEERENFRKHIVMRPQTDGTKMIQDVLQAVQQQMPMFHGQQAAMPKILLFLTEQEYDSLGINFDVNQVYEVVLANSGIQFTKV